MSKEALSIPEIPKEEDGKQQALSGEISSLEDERLSFRERAENILLMLQEDLGYYGENYDEQWNSIVAMACEDFIRPFRSGEESLRSLLGDTETRDMALEVARDTFLAYKSQIDGREWDERPLSPCFPEALSREVVTSLDVIGRLARSDGEMASGKKKRLDTALYIVSEALDTASVENRQILERWLGAHMDAFGRPELSVTDTEDQSSGDITFITLKNVISRVDDPELARRFLVIANNMAERGRDALGQNLYLITEEPILGRFRKYDWRLEERQALVAESVATRLGLDPGIVRKWKEAKFCAKKEEDGTEYYRPSYIDNLYAAFSLENAREGSARRLYDEFGIADFARYDKGMLLHQLEKADTDTPYGVIVFPEADENGAFFDSVQILGEMATKLRLGGFETRIVEAGSQRGLARRLLALNKKYALTGKRIEFLILGGHGSKGAITLGHRNIQPPFPGEDQSDDDYHDEMERWKKTVDRGYFSSDHIGAGRGIRRGAQELLAEGAPIVLLSCSTGAEGGNRRGSFYEARLRG